ncbi:hypothetical protein [[Phormidium] sp. LEGE 05292]|nr:hypothetical protein [Phormidium sp. LEGE 05292]
MNSSVFICVHLWISVVKNHKMAGFARITVYDRKLASDRSAIAYFAVRQS